MMKSCAYYWNFDIWLKSKQMICCTTNTRLPSDPPLQFWFCLGTDQQSAAFGVSSSYVWWQIWQTCTYNLYSQGPSAWRLNLWFPPPPLCDCQEKNWRGWTYLHHFLPTLTTERGRPGCWWSITWCFYEDQGKWKVIALEKSQINTKIDK